MPSLHITLDDTHVQQSLQALLAAANHLEPVYEAIGSSVKESINLNFAGEHAPDGTPWLELSDVTLARRAQSGGNVKILNDIGLLKASISYNTLDYGVEIGSNKNYANMMQFGGKKSDFPHLWGDIPARPYLGEPLDYKDEITEAVERHLSIAARSY